VLVRGGTKKLDKLVKLKNGVGVRATAMATSESDYTHFLAIHANNAAEAIAVMRALPIPQSRTVSFTSCTLPECDSLLGMLGPLGRPSWMPPFEFIVFVSVEFDFAISVKKPPKIKLKTEVKAGVVNKGGNRMLIELGSHVNADIEADIRALREWKGVKRVTVLKTGFTAMHRVLP
jgi:hypothetical protein